MLKLIFKVLWLFIYNILEWIVKIIYLMLPLGLHMFALQMREKISPVTTLTTFIDENSTWTVVYDGLVMVNTNVGAVRRRFKNTRIWFKNHTWLFVTLATIIVIVLLILVALKLFNVV